MALGFCSHTGSARLHIFLDEFSETWPSIISTDEVDSLVLAWVSGEYVIMFVMKNTES